ncbi:hypothetical protein SESBI_36390 [Sesbania bispinosa]|nr:hypothetical protein SESBI_36390 [Sesbania bispinosa]
MSELNLLQASQSHRKGKALFLIQGCHWSWEATLCDFRFSSKPELSLGSNHCRPHPPSHPRNGGLEEEMNLESSRAMTTSVNKSHSEERFGKPLMENGNCTPLVRPMYKRRKVSAIRDFPKDCGPCASKIDPVLKVDNADFGSANGTIVEDKNGECLGGDTVRISKCGDDPQHSELRKDSIHFETLGQTFDCSMKKENPVVSTHQVDGPTSANDDPGKVAPVGMEVLDTEFATENSVEHDSYISKPSSTVGEVAMSDGEKSLLLNVYLAGSSACLEESVTRRYLPRRKVSAVRNFPLFCGRNAPRLSKDECQMKISSLNNKRVGQQNLAVDGNPLKRVAGTDVKEVENNIQAEHGCKRKLADIVQADSGGNPTEKVKMSGVFEPCSASKLPLENTREKYNTLPEKSNHHQVEINSKAVVKEETRDTVQVEGTSGLELIVYPEVQGRETKPLDMSSYQRESKGNLNRLVVSSDRKVVLGLMSESECPSRSADKGSSKFKLIGGTNESKGKKVDFAARLGRSKTAIKTKDARNHSGQKLLKKKKENTASDDMGQLVIWEKDSPDPNENNKDFQIVPKSHGLDVYVPPLDYRNSSGHENDSNVTRNKVRETLRLFQAVSRRLLHEVEAKSDEKSNNKKRIDLHAAKILKEKGKYVNIGKQILGSVPGVEVGDEFQYRVELTVIGLHRQIQGGQGGNVMSTDKDKEPEDQKLERGNLALKNSSEEKNPVRVIRGSESMDGKCKTYVYDGLYLVESCWQDMGPHGKLVYRFRLRRIPGQPELALKEVKKSKKFKTREGLCVDDISYGKERIPICAVNTVDDEKPPPFTYITDMIYPDCCNLVPPEGCNCTNGCSDLKTCSCVVKNGGEIPFNHNGAIVEAKPLVYECGPYCKCPSTCHNRVSQLGIKFQLEIFKTDTRGWGVRSLNSIPSGSFICEYIGEVLEEKEAEERTGNDEYLFDIGNNYSNSNLWDGLSTLMPDAQSSSSEVVKDGGFTIDAAQFANVGRFINHSCSPNLYAQNVLYDHHDKRIPHIMFFAAENIPPLQELAYDYNYMMDQVRDSDGNIKKKECFCGSVECTGRMY